MKELNKMIPTNQYERKNARGPYFSDRTSGSANPRVEERTELVNERDYSLHNMLLRNMFKPTRCLNNGRTDVVGGLE